MYILVNRNQIKERAAMYKSMPDGRLIVPMSDQKVLGTLANVDIISTGRELKQLIAQQEAARPKPESSKEEEVDESFGVTGEQRLEAEKQEAMAIAATKKKGGK